MKPYKVMCNGSCVADYVRKSAAIKKAEKLNATMTDSDIWVVGNNDLIEME